MILVNPSKSQQKLSENRKMQLLKMIFFVSFLRYALQFSNIFFSRIISQCTINCVVFSFLFITLVQDSSSKPIRWKSSALIDKSTNNKRKITFSYIWRYLFLKELYNFILIILHSLVQVKIYLSQKIFSFSESSFGKKETEILCQF
jgi:hypothetical protein